MPNACGRPENTIGQIANICSELDISSDELLGITESNESSSTVTNKINDKIIRMIREALPVLDE